MKSWKTSLAGIAAILTALATAIGAFAQGHPIDYGTLVPAVLAGIGLLAARDVNVTSEQQGLSPTPPTPPTPPKGTP